MKSIDLDKLNPAARRIADKALEHQQRYERARELRKTKTLQEVGDEMGISKQAVDALLKGGST